jgi:hypothetical protein
MKTTFNGGLFTIDEDSEDLKGAFEFLANCHELFGPASKCKNCGGEDIAPKHRKNSGFDYYELECKGCGWRFKFGKKKEDDQLYPKGWEEPYAGSGNSVPPPSPTKGGKAQQEAIPF